MNTVKTPAGIPAYGLIRIDAIDLLTAQRIAAMAGFEGFEFITWIDMFKEMASVTDGVYPLEAEYGHAPTMLFLNRNIAEWVRCIIATERSVIVYGVNEPDGWSKLAFISHLSLHDNAGQFRVIRKSPRDINIYPEGEWINPADAVPKTAEAIITNIKTNQDIRNRIKEPEAIHKGNFFPLPSGLGYIVATQAGFKNAAKDYALKEAISRFELDSSYPTFYPCAVTFEVLYGDGFRLISATVMTLDNYTNTVDSDVNFINNFKISRKLSVPDSEVKAAMLQDRIRVLELLVAKVPILEGQLKEMEDRLIEISTVMAKTEAV